MLSPLILKLTYTLLALTGEASGISGDKSTQFNELSLSLLIAVGALELVLIYFFRIVLHGLNSNKAPLLQIDLRLTLCRFIQKYTEFSKGIKEDNPNALDKFEALIFSGLVMQDGKLPTTLDGLEPIQKLLDRRP